ncbi:MAG: MarR family winged helix-turn-helix transcriptional regulator [Marinicella sp.]
MTKSKQGQLLTDVILKTFHFNGVLTAAGDLLTQEYGLSSARWKVMGAITESQQALSVAEIARLMGLTRQAVQRLSNEMVQGGWLIFKENPKHQRAKLVLLSEHGKKVYAALDQKQSMWVNELAKQIKTEDLQVTKSVIERVIKLIESDKD